jgi:hypothetical protein
MSAVEKVMAIPRAVGFRIPSARTQLKHAVRTSNTTGAVVRMPTPAARAAPWQVASLRLPLPHHHFLLRFHLPPSVTGKQWTLLRMLTGTHLKPHVPVARALAQLHHRGPVPAAGGLLSPLLS